MSQQNSKTPRDFLRALEHKFGVKITFDLACTTLDCVTDTYPEPRGYFFDRGQDALKEDWFQIPVPRLVTGQESVGFLNNPWKQTRKFAARCNTHAKGRFTPCDMGDVCGYDYEPGIRIFSLWPAGVGTNWFRQYVHGVADVYFLSPRITFIDPRTGLPFVNKKTGKPQTGISDALLCDWAGEGNTYCWNWQETLDEITEHNAHSVQDALNRV